MRKTITVTIGDGGALTIEAEGFPDATCLKETQALEESLGTAKDRKLKAEARKISTVQNLKIGAK